MELKPGFFSPANLELQMSDVSVYGECYSPSWIWSDSLHTIQTYFIFSLVTAAERALHGVAALYSDLSPHDNAGCRLFRSLHHKATAAHAEGRSDLGEDLGKSLQNGETCSRQDILLSTVIGCLRDEFAWI